MTREKEDLEQNANRLGKTRSYAGVTTTTAKENNSTHDPDITYPFGVECSDHATSKEYTINIVNSIDGVLKNYHHFKKISKTTLNINKKKSEFKISS